VVENPRAMVAVPDFVSQSSASKSHNVAKEIPKESKVQSFVLSIVILKILKHPFFL
jgi:hypothetical protein